MSTKVCKKSPGKTKPSQIILNAHEVSIRELQELVVELHHIGGAWPRTPTAHRSDLTAQELEHSSLHADTSKGSGGVWAWSFPTAVLQAGKCFYPRVCIDT
jgi:hypothetical protein